MNENHNHDKELLEKVERLVNQGQPSGNRLLDDLAAMKPRAKADFQQELENRLTASLYSQQLEMKEKPALSTLTLKPETPARKFAAIPVTLAAAIVAVLLMSTALIWGNLPPNTLNGGIAQAVTMTATPIEATATALPIETAFVPVENTTFSDDQLTATAIIAEATQTGAALTAANTNTCYWYRVDVAIANVWSHASTRTRLIETLRRDTEVCVLWSAEDFEPGRNEWFAISIDPTAETPVFGYIIQFLLTPTTREAANVPPQPTFTPPDCEYYLPTSNFSVRREPSFNAASVGGSGTIYSRSTVCVTGFVAGVDDDYEWAIVNTQPEFPNAPIGYVRADFITRLPEGIATTTPIEIYTVGEGDTLGSVATQFGIDMEVIVSANDLTQADGIQVGQELFIPLPVQPPQAYINIPYETGILELQAVVIALVDVPIGTVLTADMLGVVYFTSDILPPNAFVDPSLLVGIAVTAPIARYQPVLAENISEEMINLRNILPSGMVAVSLPTASIVGETFDAQDGEHFTIIIDGDYSRIIEDAQILYVGNLDSEDIITLAVTPEDAETLVAAIENNLPLTFTEGGTASEPITTTFDVGGHVSSTSTVAAAEMERAAMTWMAIEIAYTPNMDTSQAEAAINEAHARGFRILLTIVGDPADMMSSDYVTNYAAYLGRVAALNPDAIEVWNEANLDRRWTSGEISGTAYVDMLRQAYEAIKAANSDVMVISGAPAPTGAANAFPDAVMNDDQWIRDVVEAGGLDYMDCLGAHYVDGVVSPILTDSDPRDDYYTRYFLTMLDTYWELVRAERPICFTQFGYLSPEGYAALDGSYFEWATNTTAAQQADWLVRAAQMSSQSGRVRLLMIWNIDFTTYASSNPLAGYAIIRPDGRCPACDAFAVARNPRPVGEATPVASILNEMMEDGRVRITFPSAMVTFVGAVSSQVDVVSIVYEAGTAVIDSTEPTTQLITRRIVSGAEIVFNEDQTISLVLEISPVLDLLNITLTTNTPIMILPANIDEPPQTIGYFQRRDNALTGYFITVPVASITTAVDQLEMYEPVTVDISLGDAHYPITRAYYWGSNREGSVITIAVQSSVDAGVLSWVEEGGFSAEITEAQ